jgi:uncharacterized membrane protein YfcA
MRERVIRMWRSTAIAAKLEKPNATWSFLLASFLIAFAAFVLYNLIGEIELHLASRDFTFYDFITSPFAIAVAGGFFAQMIDGALGMAYGVSATTVLTSLGISQAATSASVHTSEIFTSGVSGWFHLKFGNVNKKLVMSLVVPGVVGAVLGAYVLTSLSDYANYIKPVVAVYTFYLGVRIIFKAFVNNKNKRPIKRIGLLATVGGFLDSIGGGGWGPIVSSTLISRGRHPVYTIGSVNLTEFFVSVASAFTFSLFLHIRTYWQVILGLIIGGVLAAPLGAILPKKLPLKGLFVMVGVIVIILSVRNFVVSVF